MWVNFLRHGENIILFNALYIENWHVICKGQGYFIPLFGLKRSGAFGVIVRCVI